MSDTSRSRPRYVDDSAGDAEYHNTVLSGAAEDAPADLSEGIICEGYNYLTLELKCTSITALTVNVYSNATGTAAGWRDSTEDTITEDDTTTSLVRRYKVGGLKRVAVRVTALTGTSVERTCSLS